MAFHGVFTRQVPIEEEELPSPDQVAIGGRGQFGTTFGTPAEAAVGRFSGQKPVQGPGSQQERILQLRENASAIFFGMGKEMVKISKEPNGPLMTRDGSALRQRFDMAANTYAKAIVASGQDEDTAERIVLAKKTQFESKLPQILPEKGKLKPGEVPTNRDPITGEVIAAGAAAPFKPVAGTKPTKLEQLQDLRKDRLAQNDKIGAAEADRQIKANAEGKASSRRDPSLEAGATEEKDLRDSLTNTRVILGETARLREQLQVGGASIISVLGSARRVADSISSQLATFAKFHGGTAEIDGEAVSDNDLFNTALYDFSGFGKGAAESAAFKSNVIRLAYSLARSQDPGGRLSDRDVQSAMQQLAGESGSPQQILAALDEVDRSSINLYRARFRTLRGTDLAPGFFRSTEVSGELPTITTQADFDALASGKKFKDAENRTRTKN